MGFCCCNNRRLPSTFATRYKANCCVVSPEIKTRALDGNVAFSVFFANSEWFEKQTSGTESSSRVKLARSAVRDDPPPPPPVSTVSIMIRREADQGRRGLAAPRRGLQVSTIIVGHTLPSRYAHIGLQVSTSRAHIAVPLCAYIIYDARTTPARRMGLGNKDETGGPHYH